MFGNLLGKNLFLEVKMNYETNCITLVQEKFSNKILKKCKLNHIIIKSQIRSDSRKSKKLKFNLKKLQSLNSSSKHILKKRF